MKFFKFKVLLILIVFIAFSCKNKSKNNIVLDEKELNLEQLIEKYTEYNFSNCDEFIEVGNKIIDSYIKTVDLAFDGNMNALAELDKYPEFMQNFDIIADSFYIDCPDKLEAWTKSIKEKTSLSNKKIMAITSGENESIQWDESIEDELNRQMEELEEDLKRIAEEEESELKLN